MYLNCAHQEFDIKDEIDAAAATRKLAPDINRTGTVADIPDEELLRRAVECARSNRYGRRAHWRWVAVMEIFLLGSTYAAQLCRRFGLDPDEMVKR